MVVTKGALRGRPPAVTLDQIGAGVVAVGFENFSVRALAAHLGVAERTLYRYATSRDGLIALGLQHLMAPLSNSPDFADPGPEVGWREILTSVASGAWEFLHAYPAAGMEIARGVHAPVQMRWADDIGAGLMQRGFTADDAMLALDMLMDLVLAEFRSAFRFDQEQPHGAPTEREAVVERLAPDEDAPGTAWELHDARRRALALPPRDWLEMQLDVLFDGLEARASGSRARGRAHRPSPPPSSTEGRRR